MLTAAIILAGTYLGIAFTKLPRLNWDRPTAAMGGAVAMVVFGVLSFSDAIRAIDFNTIALLLGMMVMVSALRQAGFFHLLARESLALATSPTRMLVLVVVATAAASAFFVNDAVVLLFTPIVIEACRARRLAPTPYLIAEAMASNIGSTATIVGNPQNMLIGVASGISFSRFFLYLLPVAALSTAALVLIMRLVDHDAFTTTPPSPSDMDRQAADYDVAALWRLAPVLAGVMAAFFLSSTLGLPVPLVALSGGVLALLVGRSRPEPVLRGVDWLLLLFFAGLFVVIGGASKAGALDIFVDRVIVQPTFVGMVSVEAVSVAVSQVVSNVPLTMLVMPLLANVPGHALWVALAAGSTLGGNLTIIGAVANIIVVEGAAREGVRIGFGQFLKVGAIVTATTIGISTLVLGAEYWLGWLR